MYSSCRLYRQLEMSGPVYEVVLNQLPFALGVEFVLQSDQLFAQSNSAMSGMALPSYPASPKSL